MATSTRTDSNLAFNAAETALVEAESIINSLSSLSYGDSVSPKIYDARSAGALTNLWNSTYVNASSSNVDVVASQPVLGHGHSQPERSTPHKSYNKCRIRDLDPQFPNFLKKDKHRNQHT